MTTQRVLGLLAHQGGWDEILMVAAPIIVIALLLWVATKRARAIAATGVASTDDQPIDGSSTRTRSIDAPTEASRPTKSS